MRDKTIAMRLSRLIIGRLASGGIITNYFCTSACRHCLYNCGPHWEKNYISVEVAEDNFPRREIAGLLRCSHRRGRAPASAGGAGCGARAAARRAGVSIDYVETNFPPWFRDPDSAELLLARLAERPSHAAHLHQPFPQRAHPLCQDPGCHRRRTQCRGADFSRVAEFIPDLSALDSTHPHALSEFEERYGKDYVRGILGRY